MQLFYFMTLSYVDWQWGCCRDLTVQISPWEVQGGISGENYKWGVLCIQHRHHGGVHGVTFAREANSGRSKQTTRHSCAKKQCITLPSVPALWIVLLDSLPLCNLLCDWIFVWYVSLLVSPCRKMSQVSFLVDWFCFLENEWFGGSAFSAWYRTPSPVNPIKWLLQIPREGILIKDHHQHIKVFSYLIKDFHIQFTVVHGPSSMN